MSSMRTQKACRSGNEPEFFALARFRVTLFFVRSDKQVDNTGHARKNQQQKGGKIPSEGKAVIGRFYFHLNGGQFFKKFIGFFFDEFGVDGMENGAEFRMGSEKTFFLILKREAGQSELFEIGSDCRQFVFHLIKGLLHEPGALIAVTLGAAFFIDDINAGLLDIVGAVTGNAGRACRNFAD